LVLDPAEEITLTGPFHAFSTALFSFVYHLASYDSGAEALVSSGLTESLLAVINYYQPSKENITFVTRAVRVVDLITNLDVQSFHSLGGMQTIISRLVVSDVSLLVIYVL